MAELFGADGKAIAPPSPYQDLTTQEGGTIRMPIVAIMDGQMHWLVNTITANILSALLPPAAEPEQELLSPATPTPRHLKLVQ